MSEKFRHKDIQQIMHIHCACGEECTELPYIGENGNWFVGGEDTGVQARGETGSTGPKGSQGEKGEKGERGETGPKGEKGDQGEMGAAGIPGAPGAAGSLGSWELLFQGAAESASKTYAPNSP